ncbi:hypothetical protein G9464_01470 [Halostella sp. JP-L12]|uniref:DUF7096 domain-containing protein n=1 Tax=Halostella TaxID=1843185 RepID=UPI000EF7F907|nr:MULTISPECIES: hypothetical protein [Halostella]NHN46270.1 hypothetical protein [Halostella sp. JP-L12]
MERRTLLALAVLAAALVAAPAAAFAGADGSVPQDDDDANDGNESVAPGERLAGVVGVQGAEIDGEMEERTFGVRVAAAASDEARASIVAGEINDTEERLTELEQRRAELEQARDNGSISEGRYRAELAKVAAEIHTVQRMANASENAAEGIPADVLEANGVDADAVRSLRDRAENLSGPEVAEIARSIAGENPGSPAGRDVGPGDRGPGEGVGNETTADETTTGENGTTTADNETASDDSETADDEP